MNQNLKKKCPKGGQHSNRDIQALCLQQSCKQNRLLCFYCIHQKHENHQIVYLLQGLDSPIERLNINSKIENKQEHEKYIRKRIKKINHGWRSLYRIFESYINKIERNLQPQIAAIQQSFDETSARKFASVITNPSTTSETIQKHVQKIKLVMQYDLSNMTQLKVSTGVAYQDLKQAYKTANKEISTIMQKIVKEADLFSVLNSEMGMVGGRRRVGRLGIDDRNRVSIAIGKEGTVVSCYESREEVGREGGGGENELGVRRRVDNRWVEMMENKEKMENNEKIEREKVENSKREKVAMGKEEQRVNIATRSLESQCVDQKEDVYININIKKRQKFSRDNNNSKQQEQQQSYQQSLNNKIHPSSNHMATGILDSNQNSAYSCNFLKNKRVVPNVNPCNQQRSANPIQYHVQNNGKDPHKNPTDYQVNSLHISHHNPHHHTQPPKQSHTHPPKQSVHYQTQQQNKQTNHDGDKKAERQEEQNMGQINSLFLEQPQDDYWKCVVKCEDVQVENRILEEEWQCQQGNRGFQGNAGRMEQGYQKEHEVGNKLDLYRQEAKDKEQKQQRQPQKHSLAISNYRFVEQQHQPTDHQKNNHHHHSLQLQQQYQYQQQQNPPNNHNPSKTYQYAQQSHQPHSNHIPPQSSTLVVVGQLFSSQSDSQSQQQQQEQSQLSQLVRYRNFQFSPSSCSQSSFSAQPRQQQSSFLSPSSQQAPKIHLNQIYLNLPTLFQIQSYLTSIPPTSYPNIRSLQLICDTLPLAINQTILNIITRFVSLKKLIICQANGIKPEHLLLIAHRLKHLECLVLQQNYAVGGEVVDVIVKNMRKLKKFCYTSDTLQFLLFKEHNTEFMLEVDGFTKLTTTSKLTTHLPHLQTIAFQNIYKTNDIKANLLKMKKISELSILFHEKQHKINPVIEMLSTADSAKNLLHLELKQGFFREEGLIELLGNCKTLKSFGLNKCRNVTNLTIQALKKHSTWLKQLDLMEQDEITGPGFEHFLELQILSLKACWKIEQEVIGWNIAQLPKLKCINLSTFISLPHHIDFNRYWVTDAIFSHISKITSLELLQIDNNKVNHKGLFRIRNLTKISTLVCGNTELTEEDIVKFLSMSKSKIHKLSLKREEFFEKSSKNEISNRPFEGALLTEISKYAPTLTHLNIKGMKKVNKQCLSKLQHLKCLSTDVGQLDQQTFNYLKNRNVSLYVGYSHFNYETDQYSKAQNQHHHPQQDDDLIKLEE